MTGQARIRVLIAEDYAELRDALSILIGREEALVLVAVAADAAEAIALAEREQPDVALLDVRMPAGGGPAAAHGIAARSPHTKIIMLSAFGSGAGGYEPGVVGFLAKGTSNAVIIDSLIRAARGEPLARPTSSGSDDAVRTTGV